LRQNCAKITADRPGQPAYEIFSIKQISTVQVLIPMFKEVCARGHEKGISLKVVILPLLARLT